MKALSFLPPFFILPFFLSLKLGITNGQKSRTNKQTRVELYIDGRPPAPLGGFHPST
jgi:hypothetical protein